MPKLKNWNGLSLRLRRWFRTRSWSSVPLGLMRGMRPSRRHRHGNALPRGVYVTTANLADARLGGSSFAVQSQVLVEDHPGVYGVTYDPRKSNLAWEGLAGPTDPVLDELAGGSESVQLPEMSTDIGSHLSLPDQNLLTDPQQDDWNPLVLAADGVRGVARRKPVDRDDILLAQWVPNESADAPSAPATTGPGDLFNGEVPIEHSSAGVPGDEDGCSANPAQ